MKTEIESEFGKELSWQHTKGASTSRVTGPSTEDCGWATDEDSRRRNMPNAIEEMENFIKVLGEYLVKAYDSIEMELKEINP